MVINRCVWSVVTIVLATAGTASGQVAANVTTGRAVQNLSDQANTPLIALENPDREHGVELLGGSQQPLGVLPHEPTYCRQRDQRRVIRAWHNARRTQP